MRSYYIIILFITFFLSCNKKNSNTNNKLKEENKKTYTKTERLSSSNESRRLQKLTSLEFKTKVIDLGNVSQGDTIVKGHYVFKNTGDSPLLIEYVNPDCTCTDYDFTKGKIPTGEEGFIDLTFNVKNKIGSQKLYAVVRANTDTKFYKLIFKLNILEL